MRNRNRAGSRRSGRVWWTSLILTTTFCVVGCSSTGYRKGDAAASGMTSAAAEVKGECRELDATLGSLNDLVNCNGGDLKRPYHHFSAALTRLIAAAQRTDNTGRRMAEHNDLYLKMWEERLSKIDYGHIRDLSESRKLAVSQHMAAVRERYQQTQAVVQPLILYLEDIRTALGTDLTSSGLASVRGVAGNAGTNAAKVQVALQALISELSDSGAQLSSYAMRTDGRTP